MKVPSVVLVVGLSALSLASGRSLQQAPVAAPGKDALVSIIDPNGKATAAFPVVGGTDLKFSPTGITVVKPDGQVQAVMSLPVGGNGTIRVQPSLTSTGFITLSQTNGPSAQISLAPRPASAMAPAPGVPADLRANLGLMPKFDDGSYGFSYGGTFGDFTFAGSGSGSGDAGTGSFTFKDPGESSGSFKYNYGKKLL